LSENIDKHKVGPEKLGKYQQPEKLGKTQIYREKSEIFATLAQTTWTVTGNGILICI
jgi:hypothetical protein